MAFFFLVLKIVKESFLSCIWILKLPKPFWFILSDKARPRLLVYALFVVLLPKERIVFSYPCVVELSMTVCFDEFFEHLLRDIHIG